VIRKFDFDLDEDELIALMAHWDVDKVRSHVERRCPNLGPAQSRISPTVL